MRGIGETSPGHDADLTYWPQAVRERWRDVKVMTEGEFGLEWRKHAPNSDRLNYRFNAKGTGAPGSEKNLEIQWFMNKQFRLAPLHEWVEKSQPMAIDFTRYDIAAEKPQGLQRQWDLMNVLNKKETRPQGTPKRLNELAMEDRRMIFRRYPELKRRG